MDRLACYYLDQGYNCSQCILKAAEEYFRQPLSDQLMDSCSGVKNGLGIGSTCSALSAGIMVLGLFLTPEQVRKERMKLLADCAEMFGNINCALLSDADDEFCRNIISFTAHQTAKAVLKYRPDLQPSDSLESE